MDTNILNQKCLRIREDEKIVQKGWFQSCITEDIILFQDQNSKEQLRIPSKEIFSYEWFEQDFVQTIERTYVIPNESKAEREMKRKKIKKEKWQEKVKEVDGFFREKQVAWKQFQNKALKKS